ncbi:MAG: hypothetical protein LBD99_06065 [Candidatus Margulisbacteria bacterium]|jgi:hypothetical protein|nr:hypothetical protein [Candidatus Margulisiibacteriota bacterium]
MADDSLISDLLVLGFFDKDKKSPDKPLSEKEIIKRKFAVKINRVILVVLFLFMAFCVWASFWASYR